METINDEVRYKQAKKRVKEIKGFYIHLFVFIAANSILAAYSIARFQELRWDEFFGMAFWGLGLIAHGCAVMVPNFILGKGWEERKIKDIMDRSKSRNS